ncbi:thiamine pyrophosphate-dependent enzyme, partial [Staphylococcus epidermidis]|uniref:thiamine pyrophosphate-dependent enzyme n=1 Tax=Staphylococcus epidermidis TaxID=1282 RepID=UPI0028CB1442
PNRQALPITPHPPFQILIQHFPTPLQYNLPITIFLLNNKQFSFIKYQQQPPPQLHYPIHFSDIDHTKFPEA